MLRLARVFSWGRGLASAILLLSLIVGFHPASAQNEVFATQDILVEARGKIDGLRKRLEGLNTIVDAHGDDDARLIETKVNVDQVDGELQQVSGSLATRLSEVSNRLGQLGEAPKEGQPPEAPAVAEERNKLTAERLALNNLTGEANDLSGAAIRLSHGINQIRRDLFTGQLFEHTEISGAVLADAWDALSAEVANFQRMVGGWMSFVWKYKPVPLASAVMLSLFMALVLLVGEYRVFGTLITRDPSEVEPSYMSRLSVTFWSTIIPSLAVVAFLAATYFFLEVFNVLRPDIAAIIAAIFGFIGLIVFMGVLTRGVLAPRMHHWRLVPLSNGGAHSLGIAIMAMTVVNGLDYVLGSISVALSSPVVLTVMKSFISAAIVGLIVLLTSFLKPVLAEDGDPAMPGRPWPSGIALLLRVLGLGLMLLAFIGYVGLARFLATQLIVTGAVIATIYIGILSGQEISAQNRFGDTRVGRWMGRRFSLSAVALDQTGLAAGLLINIFALAVGIPVILVSWGFQPQDLQIWAYRIFTEIQIGTIRISLVGILGGIFLFALGLMATRWFQKWFDGNVLARSHVDLGVRNSVRTGAGYLGTALAGLIGISAAGIDLSSLALVAGALSLGIGFGLQNIVSNFVSGLILLVERPFKVGDWVVTGTTEGFVRRISVRATEIETFQRQSIIVPNSELINAAVGNWTHRNSLARVDVMVGVSYANDPQKVLDILKELGAQQEGVMRNPEPFVIFVGFGPSSLDFQLCVFVPDILNSLGVKNGLRVAVYRRFQAEGIEIPFPQRDINLHIRDPHARDTEPLREAIPERTREEPNP